MRPKGYRSRVFQVYFRSSEVCTQVINDTSNKTQVKGNGNFVKNETNNYNYFHSERKTLDPTESTYSRRRAEPISLVAELEKYHVPGATYDAAGCGEPCMRGTRVTVLKEAKRLITARDGSHIVWISGMAGTGKTSIALSLCDMLKDEPTVLLGGTFFFSRVGSSIMRTTARYVVPTLATLLIRAVPACKMSLVAELKRDPDFDTKTIKHQIDNLLIKPLNSLGFFDRQVVFAIDGVDQCKDEKPLRELVSALAEFKCRVPVKFLITSRPDPRIRKVRIHRSCLQPRIELYSMDLAMVTADIQHYIQAEFENSPAVPGWYSDRDPRELAEKADGVFAFAAVAVKYILSPKEASRQARRVLEAKELQAKGTIGLNELYSLILARATDRSSASRERVRLILAAILTSRSPQQVKTLAELLDLPPLKVRKLLMDLQGVVFVPEDDECGELRVPHTAFADFFFKSASENVRVSEGYGHDALARGCLRILAADGLCFNVSKTKSSYDASPTTEPEIARSLRYACIAWPFHVYDASEPSVHDEQIDSVLRRKFLFWLELASRIVEPDHWLELLLNVAASKVRLRFGDFVTDANARADTISGCLSVPPRCAHLCRDLPRSNRVQPSPHLHLGSSLCAEGIPRLSDFLSTRPWCR